MAITAHTPTPLNVTITPAQAEGLLAAIDDGALDAYLPPKALSSIRQAASRVAYHPRT